MTKAEVITKIRKCLALSRSANEHEAAAALAKAAELARLHGVDLDLIEVGEASARASRTRRPAGWQTLLADAVCAAIGVTRFLDSVGDYRFVGRGALPEIASYAFTILYRRLKAERARYLDQHLRRVKTAYRKRVRADAFCAGWAAVVRQSIKSLAPTAETDDLIGRYLAEQHPGLINVAARPSAGARRIDDDYFRGVSAGRDVNIARGVGGTPDGPVRIGRVV
ncbi:DUF2786 domain-containing protein [Sphingomonas naphthae]|uniref:DUF2786 domain-containing protein n=1 Tax=Sphingomonas naphthae TaxID=1813468 RepID=A0ABY7TFN3_9SPHN|nr:DUF2786 domain-containing protein [Sphingomonas naphthae]WCT72047.1 DUF2786 domain-containing protein [Sphingomonas naphthae]